MNEKKFKEKLVEFLMELSKPKKYEIGFVQGNKVINDGLVSLGMTATDILGFAKPENDRRIRKTRGAQAWFKNMYENGWRYAGTLEQEGLLNNGFIIMEKEIPNKVLNAIREELEILLRDEYKHISNPDMTVNALKSMGYKENEITITEINPDALQPLPAPFQIKIEKKALEAKKRVLESKELEEFIIPKTVSEPKEGFDSEVTDFIIEAQKETKTLEESFFEETGKNAIWHGKETKNFKAWKKGLENAE